MGARLRLVLATVLSGAACVGGVQMIATAPAAHAVEEFHVDFNGDGYADLVINAPGKTIDGQAGAGEIEVMYGSVTGLQPSTTVAFNEDTPGVPEAAHARDHWGSAHAVGDFNHDGYDDLAIAGEDTVSAQDQAGTVTVLWGSASGLTTNGAVLYDGLNSLSAASHAGAEFGAGLAAGDFDGDGFADLAIGAPGVSHGAANTGVILLMKGSAEGLVNTHGLIEEGAAGAPSSRHAGDWFGSILFASDLDHDGKADLLVGDPDKTIHGLPESGAVFRFWGSPTGITTSGALMAFGDSPIAYRYLGAWFAVRPNYETVLAWVPGDDTHASYVAQVAVERSGSATVSRRYTDPAPNLGLGAGMVGCVCGGSGSSFMIGDPGYEDGAGKVEHAGAFGVSSYAPGHYPMSWSVSPGANFGIQITAEDFNHDGYDDLAISAPFQNVGSVPEAGVLYVIYGSSLGPQWTKSHLVTQETPGIPGTSTAYDHWGWV